MPITEEAVRFEMRSAQAWPSRASAVLTVTHGKNHQGLPGWKAVMRIEGNSKRFFGAVRLSIVDAVKALVQKYAHRIESAEMLRLERVTASMQARRMAQPCNGPSVPKPKSLADSQPSSLMPAQSNRGDVRWQRDGVSFIHQIYGLFGDNKPMSPLFQESHCRWKDVANRLGAKYHLWNAEDLESLVKQRYPQLWDMYCGVRYPIMRCDIGRIVIIHAYGGLYADLDIFPNRTWYEQSSLCLSRVQMPEQKPRFSTKKKRKAGKRVIYFEIEIIIGSRSNEFFLNWLEHIRKEIASKSYDKKTDFWYAAKMRYVYHTTGPKSLARFLGQSMNAEVRKTMGHLDCNHFSVADTMTSCEKSAFAVISHQSNSYFTNAHSIHVPVGLGDQVLPMAEEVTVHKRRTVKGQAQPTLAVELVEQSKLTKCGAGTGSQQSVPDAAQAHSQEADQPTVLESALRVALDGREELTAALRLDLQRAREVKAFFWRYTDTGGVLAITHQMPEEMRVWLASSDSYCLTGETEFVLSL